MPSKNFSSKEVDVAVLVTELREFFEIKNYHVDFKEGAAGAIILDANKSGNPRDWVGLSLRATVRLNTGADITRVWLGNQKWVDKIIVGFVGLFLLRLFGVGYLYGLEVLLKLLLPLLVILPAVGAYLQFKIIQDAWNVVENHVALRHASVP